MPPKRGRSTPAKALPGNKKAKQSSSKKANKKLDQRKLTSWIHKVSYQQIDAWTLRLTLLEKKELSVQCFSKWGIGEGKSGRPYLRLEEPYNAKATAKVQSLRNFLQEVDSLCLDVAQDLNKELSEMWDLVCFKVNGGLKKALGESKFGKIVHCFFPHRDWTKVETVNVKTKQSTPTKLGRLIGASGNSNFYVGASINTIQFTFDESTKEVEILPYINTNFIAWIDAGQDTTPPTEESDLMAEEERQKKKQKIIDGILALHELGEVNGKAPVQAEEEEEGEEEEGKAKE